MGWDDRRQPVERIYDVTFDAAGHLETMAGDAYEFDPRGRLARVERADGTVVTMTYDYRGARIAKQVAGPGGNFAARYVDEVFEEVAGVSNSYVMANGRLVGRLRGNGRRHLHSDHRGSVVTVTRPGGAVDGRGWFGPFGHVQTEADAGGSRHYAGAVFDAETGLYYMNHRYYSPALGRFVSPDPLYLAKPERQLDVPEGHNLFVYANSSPVDYIDPSGGNWEGVSAMVEHETGHMLSNAAFGFWQGIINGIENLTTEEHDDRFFEKIAESNVGESDRDDSGDEIPFWH